VAEEKLLQEKRIPNTGGRIKVKDLIKLFFVILLSFIITLLLSFGGFYFATESSVALIRVFSGIFGFVFGALSLASVVCLLYMIICFFEEN
jgi:hypothetical protein